MKLRIMVNPTGFSFNGTFSPWYRLEKFVNSKWQYVDSGRELATLERRAELIIEKERFTNEQDYYAAEFTTIKEFSNEPDSVAAEPQPLVATNTKME